MMTREQKRARFALEKIQSVASGTDKVKYKTQLLKLPGRLHSNGLGQTVAFYLSAGKDKPEAKICGWLGEWLKPHVYSKECFKEGKLICWITGEGVQAGPDLDPEDLYRRASVEARALSLWLKRFAEAFLEE
ncbi:MAG: type III-B CRISPR module-associated protein Cmr5 [Deltaproteobacteria bacterium]|nr:type III-B CRISPR module-associated protein Cmr5 [Deltaproteobacteria bacterium]